MVPQFASLVYEVAVEDGPRDAANDPGDSDRRMLTYVLFSLALPLSIVPSIPNIVKHCLHVCCLPGDHGLQADSHGPVLGVHAAERRGHVGHHQDEG